MREIVSQQPANMTFVDWKKKPFVCGWSPKQIGQVINGINNRVFHVHKTCNESRPRVTIETETSHDYFENV